jgi:hypothetical protein
MAFKGALNHHLIHATNPPHQTCQSKPMTFSTSAPLEAISRTALHAYPPRPCKALLIGIGTLGLVLGAASKVEAQSVPQILSVPANSTPPVPAGLKVTCTLGPGTGQPSPNCPVIQYGGVRTWAYSFIDNRPAFGIVSFDPNGTVLKNVTRNGARYVCKMTVDPIAQTVSVWGQSNAKIDIAWRDLPVIPPQVVNVPASSSPPVPAGLKVTCLKGPNTLESSPTCPVVKFNGNTTWAYSFIDNRVAFGIVTYGPNNKVLANNTQNGSRYVYKITVDPSAKTVSFWGQGDAKVSLPWSALP